QIPEWVKWKAIDKWVFWGGFITASVWVVFLWVRYKYTKDELVSLKEASTTAYEELREYKSIYALAAEKLGASGTESKEEGTLGWFIYFLPSRMSLFGK